MIRLIVCDVIKNAHIFMDIVSMMLSGPWETQLCSVWLGSLCYKMCFLNWQSCRMKHIYTKMQVVSICCSGFRYKANSPEMRTMQFCISVEEGKKEKLNQTLGGNENTSCLSVIFVQHPVECLFQEKRNVLASFLCISNYLVQRSMGSAQWNLLGTFFWVV
jgi:hypothetical protein